MGTTNPPVSDDAEQSALTIDAITLALRDVRYDGWIAVELDGYTGPARDAARRNHEFLMERL